MLKVLWLLAVCQISTLVAGECVWKRDDPTLSTLRQLITVYRHGDRTPKKLYPTDPHKKSDFPEGLGQLTTDGRRRHYALGQWFRDCYGATGGFIPTKFNVNNLYVRSSDYDRTLMSAQSHLAGLYPPSGDQVWDPLVPWQPIPVHTVSKKEDSLLRGAEDCARYNQLVDEVWETDQRVADIQKVDAATLEKLAKGAGLKTSTLRNVTYDLADTLKVEVEQFNSTLPNWISKGEFEQLLEWEDLSYDINFDGVEISRLAGGELLLNILYHMGNFTNSTLRDDTYPQVMYSAHETSLSAVLCALEVFDHVDPPYAATLIIELHEVKPDWLVYFYYQHETLPVPLPLNVTFPAPLQLLIPKCPHPCSLGKLRDAIQAQFLYTNDRAAACLSQTPTSSQYTALIISGSVVGAIIVFVILLAVALRLYENKHYPHTRLVDDTAAAATEPAEA